MGSGSSTPTEEKYKAEEAQQIEHDALMNAARNKRDTTAVIQQQPIRNKMAQLAATTTLSTNSGEPAPSSHNTNATLVHQSKPCNDSTSSTSILHTEFPPPIEEKRQAVQQPLQQHPHSYQPSTTTAATQPTHHTHGTPTIRNGVSSAVVAPTTTTTTTTTTASDGKKHPKKNIRRSQSSVSKKKPSLIPQHGGGSKNDSFFKNMIQKYYSIKTDAAIDAITFQSVHHGVSTGSVQTKEKHYISRDGASSVHWACYNGDVEALEQLLHSQREDEVRDSVGRTALFYAACRGHIDCCALLMDHHDEWIDVGDRKGDTPLHVASFYQHVGVVRLLLQSAADANARNKNGYAPLHVSFCVGVCFETVVALSGGKRKRFARLV
jgi:hypothetical protein